MSTAGRPKQLIPVLRGQSLLDLAVERARSAVAPDAVWLGVGAGVASVLPPSVDRARVVVEPSGRDTLPAIGLAMAAIAAADPDAVVAVLTADHVIEPVQDFARTLAAGFAVAEARADVLVTFGVEPDHAATGFGYLELGEGLEGKPARRVSRFREKPDLALAESFVAAGPERYLWNSGMFVWRASTFLAALDEFCGDDAAVLRRLGSAFGTPEYDDLAASTWESVTKRSVDYAVMEPASTSPSFTVAAVPLSTRWLDVGSWPALGDALGRDADGNASVGQTLVVDSSGCVAISADEGAPLVALVGCTDLVVVATPTAVLVVPADQAQRVKELQAEVARRHPGLA
jgi:mannose-1-phosphate guanylyltransferase